MTGSLFTARLELAVPTTEDALAILEIAGDRRTVQHNPSDLLADLNEAQDLVERWIQHWRVRTFGYWCVREVGRPTVVGYCGLKTATVKGLSVLNLMYRFTPDVWGRGYATEVAAAAIAWASEHQPSTAIVARVRPDNVASQNVALRLASGATAVSTKMARTDRTLPTRTGSTRERSRSAYPRLRHRPITASDRQKHGA